MSAGTDLSRLAGSAPGTLHRPSLYAVLVVYGRPVEQAVAMPVLRAWLRKSPGGIAPRFEGVLLWDNSPSTSGCRAEAGIEFEHAPSNDGTRGAYFAAATRAARRGIDWLLCLDQDTELPVDYLERFGQAWATSRGARERPAAFVPRVRDGGRLVSPARIGIGGAIRPDPHALDARAGGGTPTAVSSGTVIEVEALASLLPCPAVFWLDYLDHWIFRELRRRGRAVRPIDCDLVHALSVSGGRAPDPARYRSLLRAERAFVGRPDPAEEAIYRLRLVGRALRWWLRSPEQARSSWRAALGAEP